MNTSGREMLWQTLADAGLALGDAPPPGPAVAPWYVRAMLGAAGWLGAVFTLGFIGTGLAFLIENEATALPGGLVVCGGAVALFYAAKGNDVACQFAFAVSLAGQALLAFGLWANFGGVESDRALMLVMAAFVMVLLVAPNYVHRAWCALAGAVLAYFGASFYGLAPLAVVALSAAFAAAATADARWPHRAAFLQPAGAGLGLALAIVHVSLALEVDFWAEFGMDDQPWIFELPGWIAAAGVALVAVAVAYRCARAAGAQPAARAAALAGIVAVAAATHNAPGIVTALLIAVVGFAAASRFLVGLGLLALAGYLSYFYYSLQATLLEKSITLALTGAVLIAIWLVAERVFGESRHADANA